MPFVVSFRRRLVFVHVPKTGGISLWQAMRPIDDVMLWRQDPGLAKALVLNGGLLVPQAVWRALAALPVHPGAAALAEVLAPVVPWESLSTLAVVRNPWALEVSLYLYARRNPLHPEHAHALALPDFAAWVAAEEARGPRGRQVPWLCAPDGRRLVARLLRFESLAADWSALAAALDLPPGPLPHLNRGEGSRWQDHYDRGLFATVATLRAADLRLTGASPDPAVWGL